VGHGGIQQRRVDGRVVGRETHDSSYLAGVRQRPGKTAEYVLLIAPKGGHAQPPGQNYQLIVKSLLCSSNDDFAD
jgi:hypothetical protein